MCRLLLLYNPHGVDPNPMLDNFRELSQNSKEYQGHGWGCAWLDENKGWKFHHRIDPVWIDTRCDFPTTQLFLAHARSAFRDEGITIENNMPFTDGENVFIFNGELRGVKIKVEGRIGAEKVFNYVKRFDKGDMAQAVRRGVGIIEKRTRYIRAMNFMLATADSVHICSRFSEDPDYFQLQTTSSDDTQIICSERFSLIGDSNDVWMPINNHSFRSIVVNTDP